MGHSQCDQLDMNRPFDVIVFGASGFTGRLVSEVLLRRAADEGPSLRWVMAGGSMDKPAKVRRKMGAPDDRPLIAADASDPQVMAALVRPAKVVITTVGPYRRHGEALLTACAAAVDSIFKRPFPFPMAPRTRRLTRLSRSLKVVEIR